jgi:hypothetical protein
MIDKFLDLVPSWVYAVVIVVLLVVAGGCYVRMKNAQTNLANFQAEVADNTRKAESEARAKEQAMQKKVERIANDQAKKQTVLAARVATALVVADSLRDEITSLNARPAPTDPGAAAFAREASTARELLGSCAARYRGVAQAADELRDQVSGLQEYAAVCTQK